MGEREKGGEREWEEVFYKKKTRNNEETFNGRSNVTKFYVANIPDGCRPWDLSDVMKKHGEIVGVYIAKKRNKEDSRFGFVSYKRVEDWKALEDNLQNVKLARSTLKINRAWHASENDTKGFVKGDTRKKVNQPVPPSKPKVVPGFAASSFSYRDAVRGFKEEEVKETSVRVDDSTNAMESLHKRAVVVKCCSFDSLVSISSFMGENGYAGLNLIYLGGLFMLIDFKVEKDALKFLLQKDLWRNWFSRLEIWEGQALPFERIAWVGVFGIPLHLANADVINKVCEKLGKVISPSTAKDTDINKSVECVGILSGDGGEIKKAISVLWRDKKYRVWAVEKTLDWSPKCGVIEGCKMQSEGEDHPHSQYGSVDFPVTVEPVGDGDDGFSISISHWEGPHEKAKEKVGVHDKVHACKKGASGALKKVLKMRRFWYPRKKIITTNSFNPKSDSILRFKKSLKAPRDQASSKKKVNLEDIKGYRAHAKKLFLFNSASGVKKVKNTWNIDWNFSVSRELCRPKKRLREADSFLNDEFVETTAKVNQMKEKVIPKNVHKEPGYEEPAHVTSDSSDLPNGVNGESVVTNMHLDSMPDSVGNEVAETIKLGRELGGNEETTVQPDPSLATEVPDSQSGTHDPVHQDVPTSPAPIVGAESNSDKIWKYRDPTGKIHGPFSLAQLQNWGEMGCFPNDFKIWRVSCTENESLLLLYVLKKRAIVNGTTKGSVIQKSRGSLKNPNGG